MTAGRVSFRQALSDIATGLGSHVDEATLQRLCDERTRTKTAPFTPVEPQVLEVLDYLRSRAVRLGVISNCFAEDVAAWPHSTLASRCDSALFSFDVGLAKPDPTIYVQATRQLGVDVSETWFVGDGADDELSGAAQAGLRAFKALWFLRRWPHFRDEPCAAASIANVEDVVSLVDQVMGPPRA